MGIKEEQCLEEMEDPLVQIDVRAKQPYWNYDQWVFSSARLDLKITQEGTASLAGVGALL